MTATKIQPGDDLHLTSLMAPHSLNFVTGPDRAALLAYGRDVFAAGLAGAAPAAVSQRGEYPQLPEGVMFIEQIGGDVIARPTKYAYFKNARGIVHGAELFTSEQLRAYFDLGRQPPAAPALEAPAAPAVPAGFALVPIEPTQQMLDAGRWSGAGSVSSQEVWDRMLATVTPPPAAYADDLVALVTELVQALRQAAPDNDLAGHALDYLKRNGLQGSPLLAAPAAPAVDAQAHAETLKKAARYDFLRGSNVANGTVLAEHFGGSRMQDFDAVIDAKIAARAAQAKEGGAA